MEFAQLQYFLATAKCGQVTRASEMLHISQSTVSMAISRLEEELGTKLFERVGRSIRLTDAGREFSIMITPAMASLETAASVTEERPYDDGEGVSLCVEVQEVAAWLTGAFLSVQPDCVVHQSFDTADRVEKKLADGSVDFALTLQPHPDAQVESTLLFTERVYAMMAAGHPLSARAKLSLAELADQDFAAYNGAYSLRSWLVRLCERAGYTPHVRTEVCDGHTLIYLLSRRADCVALVGNVTGNRALRSSQFSDQQGGVRTVALAQEYCVRETWLCRPRARALNTRAACLERFLLAVRDRTQELGHLPTRRELPDGVLFR